MVQEVASLAAVAGVGDEALALQMGESVVEDSLEQLFFGHAGCLGQCGVGDADGLRVHELLRRDEVAFGVGGAAAMICGAVAVPSSARHGNHLV